MKNQQNIKMVEFMCDLTKTTIKHQIHPSFIGKHDKYPFPYIFKHKDPNNNHIIFTVLYLDKKYQIVDHKSKYLTSGGDMQIMQEILQLEEDYKRLHQKYQQNIHTLKEKILSLQPKDDLSSQHTEKQLNSD